MTLATKLEVFLVTSGTTLALAVGLAVLVVPAQSMQMAPAYYPPFRKALLPALLRKAAVVRQSGISQRTMTPFVRK